MSKGVLYVVATPIGNLADWSERAVQTLKEVNWIAAEDTRQTEKLCQRYHINTRKFAYHQHNEASSAQELIRRLSEGEQGALVSDAGTPLVSDPGFALVEKAHEAGITVVPIPGACSAITALSAAGISADVFTFWGFLPPKTSQRTKILEQLSKGQTVIFFESPKRILDTLTDMSTVFGASCQAAVCRELTKQFEQIRKGQLSELKEAVERGDIPQKGEFVLILSIPPAQEVLGEECDRYLAVLLPYLGPKTASECISQLIGTPKNQVYKRALDLKKQD
jgi:16S rRNA (cytidine1402-2'-O)-methyltransferase